MGRHKTIADDELLRIARDVFRRHGHTASTRDIATAADISEAILYQRFGSKDDLFFAAMRPIGPDIEELLGPIAPTEDARNYVRRIVAKMGLYFADIIPLALRLMTHPSFDPAALSRAQPMGASALQGALMARLSSLAKRKRISISSAAAASQLLVGVAHDWALGNVFAHRHASRHTRELRAMVDVVWRGLQRAEK